MRRLYSSRDTVKIEYLKTVMENRGFSVYVRNPTNSGSAAGELSPIVSPPELWIVNEEDYLAAARTLELALKDYVPQVGNAWICPRCHEHIEGQFDACWSCGDPRPVNSKSE